MGLRNLPGCLQASWAARVGLASILHYLLLLGQQTCLRPFPALIVFVLNQEPQDFIISIAGSRKIEDFVGI